MATFDQLSAEQRAIIELVVQRGRSYDALADVLQIEVPRVRELARDALGELTPITASRVDGQWRGQVADYMLGQQSGPEATATRGHLKRSEPARTWAMSLLDTLDELYASGNAPMVPDVDDGVRERARGRDRDRARDEKPRERERDRDRDRERDREPRRKEEREPLRKETAAAPLSPEAEAAVRRRRLIGGALALVVVVVVVLLVTGTFSGGSSKKKTSSGKATTPATQTQVIGQIPLKPVKPGVTASGTAFILQRGNQRVLVVQAKLPPLTQQQRTAAYEVWLYNSRTDVASIGAQFTDASGAYQGAGTLPANFTRFKFVDISRQPFQPNTGHSGDSFLRGAFANLQPVQAGTGAGTTPGATPPGATPPTTTTPGTTTPPGTGTTPPGTGTTPPGTSTTP